MNNKDYQSDWSECFASFHLLSKHFQQLLRNCAADHLIARGCEEVGSSDTSHELYAMWRGGQRNWNTVVLEEFELFASQN